MTSDQRTAICEHVLRSVSRLALPLVLVGWAGAAEAQTPAFEGGDARWLPWLGCWQPDLSAPGGDLVCVVPAREGVLVRSYAGEDVTFETRVVADGRRREVARGGCTGWESASWSGDQRRVYLHSELVCEGGVRRSSSGVMAMLPDSRWLDVQAVDAGGRQAVRADRYRPAPERVLAAAGIESPIPRGLELALETARAAAAAELTAHGVIEASRSLETEAVEALLVASGSSFLLDADMLVRLADAGVPERVIDLMIALSYPERFAIAQEPGRVEIAAAERQTRLARPTYRDPFGWDPYGWGPYRHDPFWASPYRYDRFRTRYSPFGYGYGYGSGFGYGYDGWGYTPGTRIVIVERGAQQPQGRLVKGRGYTRGIGDRAGSPSNGHFPSSGRGAVTSSGSGSSGKASSGSSSSTGRTAKPRGSNNNND